MVRNHEQMFHKFANCMKNMILLLEAHVAYSNVIICAFVPVGRGEWLRREDEHHPHLPGVQRLQRQSEQLGAHQIHPEARSPTDPCGDEVLRARLQQHPERHRLLQGDF